MPKFMVQVLLVKEVEVEASDELQAERAAYAKLGGQRHNAIGMKVFDYDLDPDDDGAGALTDDNSANMEFVRKHFQTLNTEWCDQEPL